MQTSVLNIIRRANPVRQLDEAGVAQAESAAAKATRDNDARNPRLRAQQEDLELEQLEAAHRCIFDGDGGEQLVADHRVRVGELELGIQRAKEILRSRPGSVVEGKLRKKLQRAETELEGLQRRLTFAEGKLEANRKARKAWDDSRRQELLKRKAQRRAELDPLLSL